MIEIKPEAKKTDGITNDLVEITRPSIEKRIYVIRDKQVMLDSDLAVLYQVETGALNRAVKRNISRFPEDFRFQLTKEEYKNPFTYIGTKNRKNSHPKSKNFQKNLRPDFRFQLTKEEYQNLRCQTGISSFAQDENNYGGRRTLPYVFTEQGISMLASVLHSEVAIKVSIGIMRTFVEMRRFIANNALLFERISNVELKQLEYQKQTDEKLDQIFDAFSLIVSLIQKAEKEIVLIDGYVDIGTLNLLTKKNENVTVVMYTLKRTKLSQEDVNNFNSQYPLLEVRYTKVFHDRFLILDKKNVYHIGASLKDAGKSVLEFLIEDAGIVRDILQRLEIETEE